MQEPSSKLLDAVQDFNAWTVDTESGAAMSEDKFWLDNDFRNWTGLLFLGSFVVIFCFGSWKGAEYVGSKGKS